jgi:hypothetical protein
MEKEKLTTEDTENTEKDLAKTVNFPLCLLFSLW